MTKLRGTGIAAVNYPTGMNLGGDPSQALVHATTSGSFVVTLSATDLGQGLRTVIGQIAAETLGVPFEEIVVDTADTDTGPHDMGTFASRATHRVGNAVIAAATEAREVAARGRGRGARGRGRRPRAPTATGNIVVRGSPGRSLRDRRHRLARPVPVRPHDRRPRHLHEAQERGRSRRPGRWIPTRPRRTPAPSPRSRSTPRRARSPCSASGAPTRSGARSTRPSSRARSSAGRGWACRTRCTRRPRRTTRRPTTARRTSAST